MTFHLAGFSQSQDSAVLVTTTALLDQSLQVNGNDIIVPNNLNMLAGVYAFGASLTRAQLISPSLRRTFPNEIMPLDLSLTPTDELLIQWFGQSALQLDPGEQLNAFMAENAAGASRGTILAWLCDTPPQLAGGDIRTIRVTSTNAALANVWTNVTLTFNDVLPAGTYALLGATMQSANMQAFRFVPKGEPYRPGWIGSTTIAARDYEISRRGGLGVWCEFEHLTPPSMDVLCNGADAAFAGVMDVVYLGR